tara:strand:- start:612 stop:869 length:258 start_codon:yes stop_codon:yes gene_type:complete
MKLKILDKNAHWWKGDKTVTWATQDKKGDWWLIGGSEFPEKKVDMKTKNLKNESSNEAGLKMMLFIAIGSFLGVSLAMLLFSLII